MKLLTIIALFLTLFIRCQANTEDTPAEQAETIYTTLPAPPDNRAERYEEQSELRASHPAYDQEIRITELNEATLMPEKVIRHAYLRIQVKDYAESTTALKHYIHQRKAIISNAKEERTNGNLENSLTIRVADNNFDSLIDDLAKEGIYLDYKNISVKDVTEEYIDVATRLKTKKKVEERYLALLARGSNVKDILAIETELKSLQEEIESTEGRQRYLQNQVAYSTIIVNYYQPIAKNTPPNNAFIPSIINALAQGWEICLSFIYGFIKLWPFWLLLIMLILLIRKIRSRRLAILNSPSV